MSDKMIGIYLIGGPPGIDGHKNAYEAEALGGWPPPDKLAAIMVEGSVAVALPENVPDEHADKMTWYVKVGQSQIPDAPNDNEMFFRGATYQVETLS